MIPAWNEFADVWAESIVRASWQGGVGGINRLGGTAIVDVALAARRVLDLATGVLEIIDIAHLESANRAGAFASPSTGSVTACSSR